MTFLDLQLNSDICVVMDKLGFEHPTEVQEKAIPVILSEEDVIVRSKTGSGKTFAFALPIIQNIHKSNDCVQALIVCPTRELAIQVADETKKIVNQLGISVCAVFGGSNIARQVDSLKKNPHIVVGTTGRILDLIGKKALKIETADFVVLDEADEMLDMGFRPDIEKIMMHTKKDKQTMLFSATIPDEVKELAVKFQKNAKTIEIGTANMALETIKQHYIFVEKKQKITALSLLLFNEIYDKAIIFANTKIFAEDIARKLKKSGIDCKSLHGDMRQGERKRVLDAFRNGKIQVLVATDVASRGLDIKDVKYIINFDLPHELEFYVHRIGRTARAGETGEVINIIVSKEQFSQMREIEKKTNATILPYKTTNQELSNLFVDTKKLAKQNSRFIDNHIFENTDHNHSNKKKSKYKDKKDNYRFSRFSTFGNNDDFDDEVVFKNRKFEPASKVQKNGKRSPKHPSSKRNERHFEPKKHFQTRLDKSKSTQKSGRKDEAKQGKNSRFSHKNKTSVKSKKTNQNSAKWFSKFIKK